MVYIIKEDNNFTLPKTDKKNKKKENTPRRIILFWDNDLQIKKNTSYITQKKNNKKQNYNKYDAKRHGSP